MPRDVPVGPNLQPLLDAEVTCPACQKTYGGQPSGECDLCGGSRLVRRGAREKWLVEGVMAGRIPRERLE
jgi:rRNA maturation endonuclease Nob1